MTRSIYIVAALTTIALTGCGSFQKNKIEPTTVATKEEAVTMQESSATILEETSENLEESQMYVYGTEYGGNIEGMALYSSYPFVYNDSEWELQKYIQSDMYMDGELYLDDNAHFMIQAVSKEKSYILFDEHVQLGEPSADIWIDLNGILHLVIKDVRTARYMLTDFVYESGAFLGTTILSADGINYLGNIK